VRVDSDPNKSETPAVTCPYCAAALEPTRESRGTYMISMLAGGLIVGSAVLLILVMRGLYTGIWLTKVIVMMAAIWFAIILSVIAAAFTIQLERAKNHSCNRFE
jgi:hypothetical protein